MKKRLLAILLTIVLLLGMATTASAYTTQQYRTAEALNHLGLLYGRTVGAKDYALDETMTRAEGVTLLVRMLGKVDEALAGGDFGMPFQDVTGSWGVVSYVGYAWKHNYVAGTGKPGDVEFDPYGDLPLYIYLTIALRVMGYSDSGADRQFTWNKPHALGYSIGLIDSEKPEEELTRGEAIEIFWRMLGTKLYGEDQTLAERLIAQGVFTVTEYQEAQEIRMYGSILQPVVPSDPVEPEPSDPVEPEPSDPEPSIPVDPEPSDPIAPEEDGVVTYEEYQAMTGEEQMEFFDSFADPMDFFTWLNEAKAEYEAAHPDIEIGDDGSVDLGG